MNFTGKAKRLEDIDLPMIGREIGVGEDEIHAILDVEAAGTGFDRLGRPKMLFEPHVFWRELGPGSKRDRAVAEALAYPRWKPGAYPKDSYPRLLKAIAIDEEAALRSASWGLGQVMGFNAGAAGYASAKTMVQAFIDDEEHHLRAMIRFIVKNGLDDELRRHDWKGFARGYNGPGFAKNGYDKKLAASFARWQKIKDTPIPANPTPPAAASQPAQGAAAGAGPTPPAVQPTHKPITPGMTQNPNQPKHWLTHVLNALAAIFDLFKRK
jgi:hypothetical protein